MSTMNKLLCDLSDKTGYSFEFLVARYEEMREDGEPDWEYFVGVTLERDW